MNDGMEGGPLHQYAFEHPEFGVLRVYEDAGGRLWFDVEDVCRALGLCPCDVAGALNMCDVRTGPRPSIDVGEFERFLDSL